MSRLAQRRAQRSRRHLPPADDPITVAGQQPIGLDAPPPLSARGWLQRLEEVSTATVFIGMLVVVLIGIFWRFVLNAPLVWTVNIATLCFIWSIFLGSTLSDGEDRHIQFDILYKVLPAGAQLGCRLFGNLLLIGTFLAIIPATIDYLHFLDARRVVGASWLTFQWAYSVFLAFLILTVVHRTRLLIRDLTGWITRRRTGARR